MSTLQDAEHETNASGDDVYVIHHAAGDVVLQIVQDQDCASPLDRGEGDFLPYLAMISNSHDRVDYVGTADDVPREMEIPCALCQGTGTLAEGECHDGGEIDCPTYSGIGLVEIEDVSLYLRETRGAVAVLEVDVGSRGEQSAVLYLTAEEVDGAGMPTDQLDEALRQYADEYRRWEEGDCWGYVCTGPASDDSCWGFIGREYAEEEAAGALDWAVSSCG